MKHILRYVKATAWLLAAAVTFVLFMREVERGGLDPWLATLLSFTCVTLYYQFAYEALFGREPMPNPESQEK